MHMGWLRQIPEVKAKARQGREGRPDVQVFDGRKHGLAVDFWMGFLRFF